MSGAVKHDSAKPDLSLIPFIALKRLAEAMMVGAKKYKRFNYCQGMEVSRQVAAIMRHAALYNDGEDFDADGQHHLGSIMANCLMILRQEELGTLIDDRYKPPQSAQPQMPALKTDVYQIVAVSKANGGTEVVLGSWPTMLQAMEFLKANPGGRAYTYDIRKVSSNGSTPATDSRP